MPDLIDREKVKAAIRERFKTLQERVEINDVINRQPAIDAVPVVHGHWDCIDEDGNVWRCSVCGEDWMLSDGTPAENNMNFCTRCGAKMDEKEGEQDGKMRSI